jgi:hypothetical protein
VERKEERNGQASFRFSGNSHGIRNRGRMSLIAPLKSVVVECVAADALFFSDWICENIVVVIEYQKGDAALFIASRLITNIGSTPQPIIRLSAGVRNGKYDTFLFK